jgi:hypothetical protein
MVTAQHWKSYFTVQATCSGLTVTAHGTATHAHVRECHTFYVRELGKL